MSRLRALFPAGLLVRASAAWCVVASLMLITGASAIAHMRFSDPDDVLRLVQVRDLLAGQGWFDLHQYRADPLGGGVLMHWSRLVDLPIAAVIMAMRPLFGAAGAETVAVVVVPLVTLAAALLLVARLAWSRPVGQAGDDTAARGEIAVLACLLAAMAVPVMTQIRPMRIDHHGWQIVAALAAFNGLMARNRRAGGWSAGVALALGIAISIEGLPMALAFAAIGVWRWLRDHGKDGPDWLVRFLAGLAGASLLSFLATRGLSDLAEHCDAIAPAHLVAFGFAALAVAGVARSAAQPSTRARAATVLAGLALAGCATLIIIGTMAPLCARGPFAALDPVVRDIWLSHIPEGLPIWQQDLQTALGIMVPGLAGLAATGRLALTGSGTARRWWQDYAAALAAALVVASMVARAGGASCAFAALPLALTASGWLRGSRQAGAVRRLAALAGTALLVMPTLPISLANPTWLPSARQDRQGVAAGAANGALPATQAQATQAQATQAQATQGQGRRVSDCNIAGDAAQLSSLGRAHLLASLDIGPDLLLASPQVTVLATGHHRGGPALREVIDAFTAPDPVAHAIIRRQKISFIVLCQRLDEQAIYAHVAPGGLAARLIHAAPPPWLQPVDASSGSLSLWRVVN